MRRLLPASAGADARPLVLARALRGLADGAVSVVLADYLVRRGFGPAQVGLLVTATLLGSAAVTLGAGLVSHRFRRRALLFLAALLMLGTGLGFASLDAFGPLLLVAFVGTLNPSAGDVSLFLPLEQAALAGTAPAADRTLLLSLYNLAGALAGAAGALLGGLPERLAAAFGVAILDAERALFLLYAGLAIAIAALYRRLSPAIEPAGAPPRVPLARSRAVVLKLAALFSLDAFGGGFVVQSLLVLWLWKRFGISTAAAGTLFFVTGILGALSQPLSARIAARLGLVRTMVFTHLPSNLFLILAGLMPTAPLAVLFLVLRSAISSMDVPARQSYVLSVVPPEERTAASSVTNVPRSLASALPPLLTGLMLERTSFGWPLLLAGVLKTVYDLLLLAQFRSVPVLEEK